MKQPDITSPRQVGDIIADCISNSNAPLWVGLRAYRAQKGGNETPVQDKKLSLKVGNPRRVVYRPRQALLLQKPCRLTVFAGVIHTSKRYENHENQDNPERAWQAGDNNSGKRGAG